MTTFRSVAVLGPGGVGGYVAAALSVRGVPVTCVAREATAAIIRERGLKVESKLLGALTVHPSAVSNLSDEPDLLFVTPKATDLMDSLERLPLGPFSKSIVIPLLNGLEHMDRLRQRLGRRVVAASIRIESRAAGPEHIIQTSPFALIRMASDGDIPGGELGAVATFLTGKGLKVEVAESESGVLWEKLARLACLACTTALTDQGIGFIRSDPVWRVILESCLKEGVAVASACGVATTFEDQMRVIESMPPELSSSLQRDIAAGRPSELDAIAGAVIRAGQRHGIACPVFNDLVNRLNRKIARKH